MAARDLAESVQNLDQRLARVEQILPTLATKEDLKPVATKDELREALARLATKEELAEAKQGLEQKIEEEGDRSRRYMKILVEEVKKNIGLYAERVVALDERVSRIQAESAAADAALDNRVTALQADRPRRRRG